MNYIDFHTHRPAPEGVIALVQDVQTQGVHPWDATPEALSFSPSDEAILIGECGLDRLCNTPYDVQREVFLHHIRLSETRRTPLLIHCVRALDEVVRLRREEHATQAWIYHGFRGKPQQLHTLLRAGFYVSFGERFNAESLRQCPLDRLLLETDTSACSIQQVYARAAEVLNMSLEALQEQMQQNATALFPEKFVGS